MQYYHKRYNVLMILSLHLIAAFSSIGYVAFLFINPSSFKLQLSWVFVAVTFLTGLILIATTPAVLVRACVSGIGYLVFVGFANKLVQRKLRTIATV
jgi:hypothetical protein